MSLSLSSSSYIPFLLCHRRTVSLILDSNVLRRIKFPLAPGKPGCENLPAVSLPSERVTKQVACVVVRRRSARSRTARRGTTGSSHLVGRNTAGAYSLRRRATWLVTHRSRLVTHRGLVTHWSRLVAHRLSHGPRLVLRLSTHWPWLVHGLSLRTWLLGLVHRGTLWSGLVITTCHGGTDSRSSLLPLLVSILSEQL